MVFYFRPAIESSNDIASLIQGAEVVYSFYCLLVNVSKHISFNNRFFFSEVERCESNRPHQKVVTQDDLHATVPSHLEKAEALLQTQCSSYSTVKEDAA